MTAGPVVVYVDEVYRILTGTPARGTFRERMILVMKKWDGRKFDGNPRHELMARLALCQVGLHCHPTDGYPYSFDLIAERFRELTPELGAATINGTTLRDFLAKHRGSLRS